MITPDCGSIPNLVNEFGNYFMDKINAIRRYIGVIGKPIILRREGKGVTVN